MYHTANFAGTAIAVALNVQTEATTSLLWKINQTRDWLFESAIISTLTSCTILDTYGTDQPMLLH